MLFFIFMKTLDMGSSQRNQVMGMNVLSFCFTIIELNFIRGFFMNNSISLKLVSLNIVIEGQKCTCFNNPEVLTLTLI